jgi:hypothetical protein
MRELRTITFGWTQIVSGGSSAIWILCPLPANGVTQPGGSAHACAWSADEWTL